MSNYDVALVVDAGTLNTGMTQLYANPQAQQTLFQGTETINQLGVTTVQWKIAAVPQFVLTPPTDTQWNDPNIFSPTGNQKPAQPSDQMFQVTLSELDITFNLQSGGPTTLSSNLIVFAQVSVANNQIQLDSVAVLPINPSVTEELYLEIICGLAYIKVQALLQGYQIPPAITVEGQQFTPPVITVTGGYLILASNLTANGTPDISGVQWPQQPLGVILSRNVLSAMLNEYRQAIVQQMDSASVNHSDKNWTGTYSIDGGISNASIVVDSTLPNIDISATFSATGSVDVAWWLVPAACAIEAASNLL